MLDPRTFSLSYAKAVADLKSETQKYFAGFLWWFIEPILHMVVYYTIFGVLMESRTEHFVPFLLIGLVVWKWMVAIINEAGNSIVLGKHLMNQVYLPKLVFPMVSIMTHTFKFFLVFLILCIFLAFRGFPPGLHFFLLLPLFSMTFIFIFGFATLMASVVPFAPDFRLLVDHFFRLAFFLSGVFFSVEQIPERFHSYYYLNPLAIFIEKTREVLMQGSLSNWGLLLYGTAFGMVMALAGLFLLRKYDRYYPKIVF